ncbi:MAG: type II toxin-antitoxin system VapC family toxin [Nitrososphaerales archaeon]
MIFDTTTLIQTIRNGADFEEGSISVITLIEFLRGIENEEKRKESLALIKESFDVLDVTKEVAQSYLKLYFELKKKGKVVSDADALIAATAHAMNEIVLTMDNDFMKFVPMVKVKISRKD